ncbi:MAG TPA: phosphate ABC transporter permease PstA [Candidatus Dojkabacteria bacterium]|jgi:phosphate transport system permease protein
MAYTQKINRRKLKKTIILSVFKINTILTISFLVIILGIIIYYASDALSLNFFTKNWEHNNIEKGGIFPAILGSLYISLGIALLSFPIGIASSIFTHEFNSIQVLSKIINFMTRLLTGIPSIIYGLFGLAIFVNLLNFGPSLGAAILTLSIMTLPWIIAATNEALEDIPIELKESSFALGADRTTTLLNITFPMAFPGMLTGLILGLSRSIGETAPIILVGATFFLQKLPDSIFSKFLALPYHTFILATQHSDPKAINYAAASALTLIVLIFIMNSLAFYLRYKFRKINN